jgi:hypothetical protein
MVRLHKPDSRRSPDYSSRWEQLRLLFLIVPLGLVIILMFRLRDPKTAQAINNFFAASENDAVAGDAHDIGVVKHSQSRQVAGEHYVDTTRLFPGVRRELLETIEDNSYFRNAEKDAWFHFIERLQDTEIVFANPIHVEYAQLVEQPDVYRGRLVTVRGTARQITVEKPADNDLGLTSYYRVVIQPADGANWPMMVYALKLPEGISPGDDLSLDVNATGLFFKKLSYRWRDGLGIAPVVVTKYVDATSSKTSDTVGADSAASPLRPVEREAAVSAPSAPSADSGTFQDILSITGWTADRLAKLDDGQRLSREQREEALSLLHRLRRIDSGSLDEWSHELPPNEQLEDPENLRGQLYRLRGRVTNVIRHELPSTDAERLEMPAYFECEMTLDKPARAIRILTTRVPNAWLAAGRLAEPSTAIGLYLKRVRNIDPPADIWLSKEIAWHPSKQFDPPAAPPKDELYYSGGIQLQFGKAALGSLGMDVGLLDLIQSHGRIRAEEREAFYQLLDAVDHADEQRLIQHARQNLRLVRRDAEYQLPTATTAEQKVLLKEVMRRAQAGSYSVAPLFNDADRQVGRLFVFDGVARRVARVEVGMTSEGKPSDVHRRFGIDHYYEIEIFTDDSQNYPLVFCVRELPAGFPTGGDINVPVRIAGFFFKDWLYRARGSAQVESGTMEPGERPQYAPLLIGKAPIVLAAGHGGNERASYVVGALFLLALGAIVAAAAWFARDERLFRQRTPAANFLLPPGQSLNELNLPVPEEPMKN